MISELIDLSAVIGDIYDAAVDPGLWQQALKSICDYVGGASAVLYWHDAASLRSEALYLFNESPSYTKLYFEKYLPMNPMFPTATFIDVGLVTTSDDIMPRSELIKTQFYKEWLRPQKIEDALSVNLEKGVARSSLINIRTERIATQVMRRRLALLVPHIQRAVTIGSLFEESKAAANSLTQALDHIETAVVLVGAGSKIAFANSPARKALAETVLIREERSALRLVAPSADRALRTILVAAGKGSDSIDKEGLSVPLTNAPEQAWFAHVLPLTSGRRRQAGYDHAAVAAVFIRKSQAEALPPLEIIAKQYKLSAGEIRVLDAMLRASGVKAMAKALGLSQATIKTHLHNLFRKTNTTRQSELMKLIAGIG